MPDKYHRIVPTTLPPGSIIAGAYVTSTDYADAYSIELPNGVSTHPETLARFIFGLRSPLTSFLLRLRDALVGGLGLKTAKRALCLAAENKAERINIFRIYSAGQTEILLGEDDTHLDFRVSVLCSAPQARHGQHRLTLSTVVHCHNRFGRAYIRVIAPFHRMIVQSSLRRAARVGWPPPETLATSLPPARNSSREP